MTLTLPLSLSLPATGDIATTPGMLSFSASGEVPCDKTTTPAMSPLQATGDKDTTTLTSPLSPPLPATGDVTTTWCMSQLIASDQVLGNVTTTSEMWTSSTNHRHGPLQNNISPSTSSVSKLIVRQNLKSSSAKFEKYTLQQTQKNVC